DASRDKRFARNPLVTGNPHIRFFAAMPLIAGEGARLGILAVAAPEPRESSVEQEQALRVLARHANLELELRRPTRGPAREEEDGDKGARNTFHDLKVTADEATNALRQSESFFHAFM